MTLKLFKLSICVVSLSVCGCHNVAPKPQHFSFERTNYVLAEGASEEDLQGAPWINANIRGMVDNVEKPELKDDFYTAANYEMFKSGELGPFDKSSNNVNAIFDEIREGTEDFPNRDLMRSTRTKLGVGNTSALKTYIDNLDVSDYVSSREVFYGNCGILNLTKPNEESPYVITFNDGYTSQIYGYQTLAYYGYFSHWYPQYQQYEDLGIDVITTLYKSLGYSDETATYMAETGQKSLQEDIIFVEDESYEDYTTVSDVTFAGFKSALLDAGLSLNSPIYVSQADYICIKSLYNRVNAGDVQVKYAIKNIVAFERRHVLGISDYAPLSRILGDIDFFYNEVDISNYSIERAKGQLLNLMVPFLIERAYLYFDAHEDVKAQVTEIIEDVLTTYKEMISKVSWLSDETKAKIIRKLDFMGYTSCYSDKIKNLPLIDETNLESMNLLDIYNAYQSMIVSTIAAGEMETNRNLTDGMMSSYVVNAFYSPYTNEFVILNGLLSGGFVDTNHIEVSYARVGTVIGHEISHAFDSSGAYFDEYGEYNKKGWWTPEDMATFKSKVSKLRLFWNKINLFDGQNVVGRQIDGEATADMGGVAVILELAKKVPDFDYDLFFRSYASLWKETYQSLDGILQDSHPFAYLRCNVTLAQFDKFYETYGINYGDGMFIPKAERVNIW